MLLVCMKKAFLSVRAIYLRFILILNCFLVAFITGMACSSWLILSLVLIFLGGMIVVFIYASALRSWTKLEKVGLLDLILGTIIFMLFRIMRTQTFPDFLNARNLRDLYYSIYFFQLIFLIFILIYVLFITVSLTESFKGSLNFFVR